MLHVVPLRFRSESIVHVTSREFHALHFTTKFVLEERVTYGLTIIKQTPSMDDSQTFIPEIPSYIFFS